MGDSKFRQTNRRTAIGPFRTEDLRRKQEEGAIRLEHWQGLTVAEKIASLVLRAGRSRRQLTRLRGEG